MAITDPWIIDLQFVSDETNPPPLPPPAPGGGEIEEAPPGNHSEVFGISITKQIDLETVGVVPFLPPPGPGPGEGAGWVDEGDAPGPPPDVELVYGVSISSAASLHRIVNLGSYDGGFYLPNGLGIYQRRPTAYFRVQLDGGGRQVMYAAYGDDSPRRFFELWKDGVRFSFLGIPDPKVQLRSPSGIITTRTVFMRGRAYGRFGVDLGELNEIGDWKLQIRFVEESDSMGVHVERDESEIDPQDPPEAPGPALWRALHKPLILRVCRGAEDIW